MIGEVADVVGGGTPNTSEPANFSDDGHPWITPADLSGFEGVYIQRGKRGLTEKGLRSSSATIMPKGAVLMSSRAPIGYIAIAGNPVCTNQGFKSFVLAPGLIPEFCFCWLKFVRPHLEQMGSGSTFLEISGSRAREIPVLLAPTEEQKRISAKVEELLTKVNAARDHIAKVPKILKRFRQSVLAAACSGRLTEEWREKHNDIEPASDLIARIRVDRRSEGEAGQLARIRSKGDTPKTDKWKDKYSEPEDPEVDDAPDLPDTWCLTGIEVLLSTTRRGMKTGPFGSSLKRAEHQASGIPVLGIENIGEMTFIEGSKIHISKTKAEELAEFDALPGDILISRSGTVGEVCVVPRGLGEARISTNIMRVTVREEGVLPTYFCYLFNGSPFVLHQVSQLCGGSTRDFLNQNILRSILFPLPSIEEQHEIVRRVEALFKLADVIRKRVEVSTKRAETLTQAILARAFRGELVATEAELARREGRDYEPASALLERIKDNRERSAQKEENKQRRRKSANAES